MFFDLDRNSDALPRVGHGVSVGRRALIKLWKSQQVEGVSHVARNLETLPRPAAEALDKLAEHVQLRFQASHSLDPISTTSA